VSGNSSGSDLPERLDGEVWAEWSEVEAQPDSAIEVAVKGIRYQAIVLQERHEIEGKLVGIEAQIRKYRTDTIIQVSISLHPFGETSISLPVKSASNAGENTTTILMCGSPKLP
jgi:hypothetical protein